MPYIIDGHNLVPKIPGLNLADVDDEDRLVEILLKFCHHQEKRIEVFFDKSPPGGVRSRNHGPVTARFVPEGTSADEAIYRRLKQLGRAARNWIVVSSDQRIRAEALAVHSQYLSSEDFAITMLHKLASHQNKLSESEEVQMNREEIEEWMRLFNPKEKE